MSTSNSDYQKLQETESKTNVLSVTHYLLSMEPKLYLGVLPEWMWIIDLLHKQTNSPVDHIKLTLQKIRLNNTFTRLGPMYAYSICHAGYGGRISDVPLFEICGITQVLPKGCVR
ncbi:hypothetical protein TKK_0014017 [Trichogramma kaykai]